jgi:hypothetical protein
MPPLDFPNAPTIGDQFAAGGATWAWDGVKWTSVASASGVGGPFLPLAGGILTGKLTINAGGLNVKTLPLSATGLGTGDIYINGGFLCVMP